LTAALSLCRAAGSQSGFEARPLTTASSARCARSATPTLVREDTMTTAMTPASLTEQFNAQYRANLVPQILKTIRRVKQANQAIVLLAMGISYTHQAHFLHGLGAGPFAYAVPVAFDLLIYVAIKVTQTPGLVAAARRAAITLLVPSVLVSATVNAVADGHLLLRVLYAVVVAEIAAAEWLASKIRPDFTAIEQVAAAAAPAPTGRKLDPAVAAERAEKARLTRERNRLARLSPQQKAALTRQANRRADELDRMAAGYVPANAPVSPAVG
jgi:signal transduction histidine kinase